MADARHGSAIKPISIPVLADVDPANWDRVQTCVPAATQPKENVYEEGRLAKMTVDKQLLETKLSISQLEYGKIDSFLQLAGLAAEPGAGLALSDFSSSKIDFYVPGKSAYGGTLEQTYLLEKMVVDSFAINITADQKIERTFELSGNYYKTLANANKNLIFKTSDAPSGTSGSYTVVLSNPAPVVDPNNAGVYLIRVVRVRGGVGTELTLTTDYTWTNGTTTLTILAALASDHYRIWYSSGSYGTAGDPFVLDDVNDYFLSAENVTVTLDDGVNAAITLDKLKSLSITATLNRLKEAVIGSTEYGINEIESYDVKAALSGMVKDSSIQEALALQAGQSFGIIDYTLLGAINMSVKIYSDSTKTSFLMGFKITDLEFDDDSQNTAANAYADESVNMSSDNLLISETVGTIE
jgi:hypothetical protein